MAKTLQDWQEQIALAKELGDEDAELEAREAIFKLSQKPQEGQIPVDDIGAAQSLLIGMGKGFSDVGRGIGLVDPETEDEKRAFEALQSERPITSNTGEILGQALPFIPAALTAEATVPALAAKSGLGASATQAARIAAQGAVGATEGGIISRGKGNDVLEGAGIGGLVAAGIEAVSPRVGRAIGAVFRRLTGKQPKGALVTVDGKPTEELQKVLDSFGITFDDFTNEGAELLKKFVPESPEQVARKTFLESQGLKPTRAQVTRDASDFQLQQETAKTSGRVRNALESQEAFLSSRFDNAILDAQSFADNPSSVINAVVDKATALDNRISNLYRAAREMAPEEKNIKLASLVGELRNKASSNQATNGAVKAVVGDLQSRGILDKNLKVKGRIDVQTAEEVRKFMNSLYDPQNGFRNSVLRDLKDTLDKDVFTASGQDLFKQARAAKTGFEKGLERAGVSKFDSRKTNLVRDILENKVNPDDLVNQVVRSKKYRAADLKQLKNYIAEESPEALESLRSDTLQSIKDKAFVGPEDAAGNKALSRAALESELKKIGPQKMDVLFTPSENKFLKDMLQVSKLREPVRGTALGRGPSAQAIARIEKTIRDIPLVGSIVDFIDIDASGRTVLKAKPKAVKRIASDLETQGSVAAGTALVPSAIAAEDKREK